MLYANTKPFYARDLSIYGFWCLLEGPGINPLWIQRDDSMAFANQYLTMIYA